MEMLVESESKQKCIKMLVHQKRVFDVTLNREESLMAGCDQEGFVSLWTLKEKPKNVSYFKAVKNSATQVQFGFKDKEIFVSNSQGQIKLLDVETNQAKIVF